MLSNADQHHLNKTTKNKLGEGWGKLNTDWIINIKKFLLIFLGELMVLCLCILKVIVF